MLILKARHDWSDTSFNDLMSVLADTYLDENKVPANTYQVKKLIQPVEMKVRKFDVCPNHYIF